MSKILLSGEQLAQFQRRVHDLPCELETMASKELYDFLQFFSQAHGTDPVFCLQSLLGVASLCINGKYTVNNVLGKKMPVSIWTIFIGPPGSGKSVAIRSILLETAARLMELTLVDKKMLVTNATKEGLLRAVEKTADNKCLLASDEAAEFLASTAKRSKQGGGDLQMLNMLFEGTPIATAYSSRPSVSSKGRISSSILNILRFNK